MYGRCVLYFSYSTLCKMSNVSPSSITLNANVQTLTLPFFSPATCFGVNLKTSLGSKLTSMLLHFPFRIMDCNLGSSWQSQRAINTSTNNTTTRSRSAVGNTPSRVIDSSDRCGTTAHCRFPSASVVWSLRRDRRRAQAREGGNVREVLYQS